MDRTKGLFPNHVFAQKSRWPYSMQSKFGMDKIQRLYGYMASGYIFTSPKKVTDYLYRLKAYDNDNEIILLRHKKIKIML